MDKAIFIMILDRFAGPVRQAKGDIKMNKKFGANSRLGFTLVEVLVVLVIITILLSLVLPAFNAIHEMAINMRQKAQFASIEVGLEGFKNDFGDYPESSYLNSYGGAQKLAEAMVGMDGFGVHEDTDFNADAMDDTDTSYYYDVDGSNPPGYDQAESLTHRKGPYLETDSANAIYLNDIGFPVIASMSNVLFNERTMILADQYGKVKNKSTNKTAGMPVLYYKAGTAGTHPFGGVEYIYEFDDNWLFAGLSGAGNSHPWLTVNPHTQTFYPAIKDSNYAVYKPHRPESFILLSAGPDGIYGTSDDVYNFDAD